MLFEEVAIKDRWPSPSCVYLLGLNASRLIDTTIVKASLFVMGKTFKAWQGGMRQRLGLVLKKVKTKKDDMTLKKRTGVGRPAKVLKTSTPIAVQLQGQMYNNALSAKDLYRWADCADSSGAQGLKDVSQVAVQGYKAGSNLARDMRKALRHASFQNSTMPCNKTSLLGLFVGNASHLPRHDGSGFTAKVDEKRANMSGQDLHHGIFLNMKGGALRPWK